jgi:hypothetical protein
LASKQQAAGSATASAMTTVTGKLTHQHQGNVYTQEAAITTGSLFQCKMSLEEGLVSNTR